MSAEPPSPPLWREPSSLAVLACWCGLGLLALAGWGRGEVPIGVVGRTLAGLALSTAAFAALPLARGVVRERWRMLLVYLAASSLYYTVGRVLSLVNDRSYEAALLALDEALFGANLVVAAQAWVVPWFVGLLQWVYGLYFFVPVLIALPMVVRGDSAACREYSTAMALAFVVTFAGYVLVPASSPYVFAQTAEGARLLAFAGPLPDVWLGDWIRATIHDTAPFYWDCFPSGHTTISALAAIMAVRAYGIRGLPAVVYALLVMTATMVLRYHYAVDVLVGLLVAAGAAAVTPAWLRRADRMAAEDPAGRAAPSAARF